MVAGIKDDAGEMVFSEQFLHPVEMLKVIGSNALAGFHFNAEDMTFFIPELPKKFALKHRHG